MAFAVDRTQSSDAAVPGMERRSIASVNLMCKELPICIRERVVREGDGRQCGLIEGGMKGR